MRFRGEKWVESELRFYLCRELHRADIEEKIKEMDSDIKISCSSFTGMPRGSSAEKYSTVERQVEFRDEARTNYLEMLEQFNKRAQRIGNALYSLLPIYREVISLCYFSMRYIADSDIAAHLSMDIDRLQEIKDQAIHELFEKLDSQAARIA